MIDAVLTLDSLNGGVLAAIDQYWNLRVGNLRVQAPYVINTIPNELVKAMRAAGINGNQLRDVFSAVKGGDTELGSFAGKGSPEQLQADLDRLVPMWLSQGTMLTDEEFVMRLMQIHHVGIDCSGLVYNLLAKAFGRGFDEVQGLFAWGNPEKMRATRAGAFVFDSDQLILIPPEQTQPLDIWVYDSHGHVGIVVENDDKLYLADSSPTQNVSMARILTDANCVQERKYWTQRLRTGKVIVRRIPMLNA